MQILPQIGDGCNTDLKFSFLSSSIPGLIKKSLKFCRYSAWLSMSRAHKDSGGWMLGGGTRNQAWVPHL
jgi:hypothetical protein